MKSIIIKLKAGRTLDDLVDEVMFWFGEGARPGFFRQEDAFAYNNTHVHPGGWLRIPADDQFVAGVEFMLAREISQVAETIIIEYEGQKEYGIENGELLGCIDNCPFYSEQTP